MQSYKEAGVDIAVGNQFIEIIKKKCPDIGGFGGLYPLGDSFLVASTDGVGTKLKNCFAQNRHDCIGIDLVAMCVNDIITTGAKPLFFLDYFATSKLNLVQAESIIDGIIKGCFESECQLLGGETAEMPGFYKENEYDLSGFSVGIIAKKDLIDGSKIKEGDLLVGIASNGLHSNGFSLVNKILEKNNQPENYDLLTPTKIYVKDFFEIKAKYQILGVSHITGGGLTENVPRMLPKGLLHHIEKNSWRVPEIFSWLQEKGKISEDEMFKVFNMGIGLVIALSDKDAHDLIEEREDCYLIGKVFRQLPSPKGEGL